MCSGLRSSCSKGSKHQDQADESTDWSFMKLGAAPLVAGFEGGLVSEISGRWLISEISEQSFVSR